MTDKPTDAELKAMWQIHAADIGGILDFARAVLAKWGRPSGAGEPVAWWIPKAEQFCIADKSGDRPFAKAWEPLYTATQPTQPQAGAVPLTGEQIKALMQAHRTAMLMTCKARVPECGEFAAIAQDLDWLCETFGIKGDQHG